MNIRVSAGPRARRSAFPDAVRLRQPAFPRHGVGSGIPAGPSRSGGLCGPRSKLTTDRSGNRARASPPMGTATSTSLPSHITEWCSRNRCRSLGRRTGTPGSTGTPALPFDIQRVCGPDIGCTFPRCGTVPPFRIRRPVRSARA